MRGLYVGYPEVRSARCHVVLSLEEEFAPQSNVRRVKVSMLDCSGGRVLASAVLLDVEISFIVDVDL